MRLATMRLLQIVVAAVLTYPIGLVHSQPIHEISSPSKYPSSQSSYEDVSIAVGCESRFIEEKKKNLFESQYRDHWMTWEGKVIHAEPESVSLDMNDKGIHELQAKFSNPNAGYDVLIDSTIKVRFILRSQGGCILPFTGDSASIVK